MVKSPRMVACNRCPRIAYPKAQGVEEALREIMEDGWIISLTEEALICPECIEAELPDDVIEHLRRHGMIAPAEGEEWIN